MKTPLNKDGAGAKIPFGYDDYLPSEEYHLLRRQNRNYLCTIPIVRSPTPSNTTDDTTSDSTPASPEDQKKELDRALSRGRELLSTMEQCLYYSTGWWTYSFCYNGQVRQFHALPPTAGGAWPPKEDPSVPGYALGKYTPPSDKKDKKSSKKTGKEGQTTDLAPFKLETRAETSYLTQTLPGGTTCDLTGKQRTVTVEFHCNPQLTDRIGWIKETATCEYLMIVYTPRLCGDVAFLPPKEAKVHGIECKEMLRVEEVPEWERRKKEGKKEIGDGGAEGRIVLGNVIVGGRKYLGPVEKGNIERGRIVLTPDEKAETILQQKGGKVSAMSKADLKKLGLSPEGVEAFRKELVKLAGGKDWKIEKIDEEDGVGLRGIVEGNGKDADEVYEVDKDNPDPEDEKIKAADGEDEEGSEEVYKEEI
jgi:hypothetical protein